MCLITMLSFVPAVASADEEPFQQTVTIESQTNSAFDYLEYYNGSKWKDLNTPRHWVESTGQVCYCIEHTDGNPHGATYTATAPSQVFGANTLAGLQTILMYGYPCNTPDGFTEDEARQTRSASGSPRTASPAATPLPTVKRIRPISVQSAGMNTSSNGQMSFFRWQETRKRCPTTSSSPPAH